jgi:DNA repair protein RecN (Recombination protein N)
VFHFVSARSERSEQSGAGASEVLTRLAIRELALVEALELELGPGLNVFTGETGAGKSIVLSALALLAGGRASADAVREGAEEARVEAVLDTGGLAELEATLSERGLAPEGHELIVRRALAKSGRSRAWLGADLVPLGVLAELLGEAIEVSSQHASQALLRPDQQGRLLDAFAGCAELRAAVEAGVAGLRQRDQEIAALRAAAEERARRSDYLSFQVRELDEARIDLAEAAATESEHRRLANAEQLRQEAQAAAARLSGDPEQPEAAGAADLTRAAARTVADLARLDAGLAPLAERLAAAHAELADLAGDLERYAARSDADPARLAELDARLRELERVKRKYGGSLEAALARREEAAAELASLGASDERLGKLEGERAGELARLERDVAALSAERARAAAALAEAATAAVRELALGGARLEVALLPAEAPPGLPCGAAGAETVELRFSANAGEPLRALRSVASGGELSRVFLALRDVLRGAGEGRVLVFDEVDAGIGGAVAERVGARLAALSKRHQILCITHLPQLAAYADRHFRVEKRSQAGRTRTTVTPLDAEGRVREIARMAGGTEVGAATLDHARALLDAARKGPSTRKKR